MTNKELEECQTTKFYKSWDALDWCYKWKDKLFGHIAHQAEEVTRLQQLLKDEND